jgi:hypothetical protein
MTEVKKRGPGRPRKEPQAARSITPPSVGAEIVLRDNLRAFIIACNKRDEAMVDQTRNELIDLINLLSGVVEP